MSSTRTRFGAYLLTDCIGQGGMAVVYRAKREGWSGFEKTVVVKAMLPVLALLGLRARDVMGYTFLVFLVLLPLVLVLTTLLGTTLTYPL